MMMPRSNTMVVPAVPIIMCSMRLIRRMVSFHRSVHTASCVSICACTDAAVGLLILFQSNPVMLAFAFVALADDLFHSL